MRRKHNTLLAGVAVALALLAGGGIAAAQSPEGQDQGRRAGMSAQGTTQTPSGKAKRISRSRDGTARPDHFTQWQGGIARPRRPPEDRLGLPWPSRAPMAPSLGTNQRTGVRRPSGRNACERQAIGAK